jgi:predicted alpha-1,2-mannosidase
MYRILLCLLLISCGSYVMAQKEPVDFVDPFIGTSTSRWMLFPGASMPFGMVKLSPDNQQHSWKAGYEYNIDNIAGFSHIHSCVMGGLLMMPVNGPIKVIPGTEDDPDAGYRSRIDHHHEDASPGYYSVLLKDYDIQAELTSTVRAGFQRYTYEQVDRPGVLIDLTNPTEYGYRLDWGSIRQVGSSSVEGFAMQHTLDGFSGLNNQYTIHFVIEFDHPIKSMTGWSAWEVDPAYGAGLNPDIREGVREIYGHHDVGAHFLFDLDAGAQLQVRSAISLVSIEQARLNLQSEIYPSGWDFDQVHQQARKTWNELLNRIEVEGGTEEDRVKFYTNLYRSYAARTIWSDVNGQYVDPCEQIQTATSPVYGCDAFWNTFWNLNQLWTLVTPAVANDWVVSLLEIYDKGGWLPKGPTGIEYSSIMVASHEVALINSAYQKGIRNYDVAKAYEAIKRVQTTPAEPHPCGGLVGNRQLEPYMRLGYVPHGPGVEQYYFGTPEEGPVSNTLEYAFDDWNVAQMALELGHKDDYQEFISRAGNFINVFNREEDFMMPRLPDGTWLNASSVFGEAQRSDRWKGTGFIEGNAWQYTWFVPHDVNWLVTQLGRDTFIARLNQGFETSAEVDFNAPGDVFSEYPVNHGNQPNMQAAYLFNYAGAPWLTQKWVRAIMNQYYGSTPEDGWPGDEDQGQMGAWYVISAMGLFQMDGGGAVEPIYEIGSPLFDRVTIHLDPAYYPGGTFTIQANNNSAENLYIHQASLNGKSLEGPWFYHRDLVQGGTLVLEMGSEPNQNWGRNVTIPSMSTMKN